jgi:hypothetical protein
MKKAFGLFLAVLVGFAVLARADGYRSVSLTVTNGQAITYSDPIVAAGYLEKIEVVQSTGGTSTVTVATYDGTTAIDTFASLTTLAGSKVVRLLVAPTDNTGTALAAVTNAATSFSTVLSVPYERAFLGGNIKMAVTAQAAGGTGTNTVTARLYFSPIVR